MNENARQIRDEFAARCTTEADRRALARYDRLMREIDANLARFKHRATVELDERSINDHMNSLLD